VFIHHLFDRKRKTNLKFTENGLRAQVSEMLKLPETVRERRTYGLTNALLGISTCIAGTAFMLDLFQHQITVSWLHAILTSDVWRDTAVGIGAFSGLIISATLLAVHIWYRDNKDMRMAKRRHVALRSQPGYRRFISDVHGFNQLISTQTSEAEAVALGPSIANAQADLMTRWVHLHQGAGLLTTPGLVLSGLNAAASASGSEYLRASDASDTPVPTRVYEQEPDNQTITVNT
jgi:hypothetical protein